MLHSVVYIDRNFLHSHTFLQCIDKNDNNNKFRCAHKNAEIYNNKMLIDNGCVHMG